jgi:cytochrome b561/polyisoprenoid-binding protein YceI
MLFKNTETQFGAVTKTLHWTIALLIIFMLGLGLWMSDLPMGGQKLSAVLLHKSIGITVLVLMLCRVLWHFYSHRPREVDTLKPIDKAAASAMHYMLYVLALAIPLAGWAMSSAMGRSVSFFGLFTLPDIVAKDEAMGKLYESCHNTMAYILIALVSLHVLAALKHHFVEKDIVLKRMLPAFIGAALLMAPALAQADAGHWNMAHEKSSITFRPKQMGAEFKGTFGVFSADIQFNPDDLAHSKATIDVQLGTAHTGAPDRDENLKSKDWFDVADFPDAIFTTTSITKTGDGTYKADGTLTIKNITQPVTLPFKLSIAEDKTGKTATMDGTVILDRSKFQIGAGKWTDVSIIANEVPVDIHVIAVQVPPPTSGK